MPGISVATTKEIMKKIEELDAPELINYIRDNYSDVHLGAGVRGRIFEKICGVNKNGFSKAITVDYLVQINSFFRTSNGGDWTRDDSYLGRKYHIKKEYIGNRTYSVKLDGFNHDDIKSKRTIVAKVRKALKDKRCSILDVESSNGMEIDHKNARYDKLTDNPDDYQWLSKAANDAKRQHCKRCRETGKRYDATRLGYSAGWTMGDADSSVCDGCYWFDPKAFNAEISKGFKAHDE